METFAQLKREADELWKAVADVAAAMTKNEAAQKRGITG
jgi:hypothetical protein